MRVSRLAPLVLVALMTACQGWRVETVPPAEYVAQERPDRIQVTRTDRTKVVLYTPSIVGDSLRGFPTEKAINPITVPLDETATVSTRHFSMKKTVGLVLVVGAGLIIYDQLMKLNQTGGGGF